MNSSQDNMCTIMPAPILGRAWTIQQAGTQETTKTVNGNSCLHRHPNQENSHERESAPAATMLHSRWSSSTRGIVDKPPSQPLRYCPMSGVQPSSASPVKERHQEDPGTSEARRLEQSDSMSTLRGAGTTKSRPPLRRGQPLRRLEQSDSMWTSGGAGTTKSRPPLRRGQPFRRLLHGACRWTSSCRATLDRAPTPAPAPHRMIVGSSGVSAIKPSVEMKDRDIFEITCMALCIFNMSGKPPASIKSPVSKSALTQMHCLVLPRMTPHASIISNSAA